MGSGTWPGPESSGNTGFSLCGRAGFHNSVLTILLAGASVYITPLHLAGAFTRIPKFAPAFIQLSLWWGRPSQWGGPPWSAQVPHRPAPRAPLAQGLPPYAVPPTGAHHRNRKKWWPQRAHR